MKIEQNLKVQIEEKDFPPGKKKTLLTAIALFSSQGFAATSTAQIAKQGGISEGTIFKYFKTKENLLNEILTLIINQLLPDYQEEFMIEFSKQNFSSIYEVAKWFLINRYAFIKNNEELFLILFDQLLINKNLRNLLKEQAISEEQAVKVNNYIKKILKVDNFDFIIFVKNAFQLLFGFFIEETIIFNKLPENPKKELDILAKQLVVTIEK